MLKLENVCAGYNGKPAIENISFELGDNLSLAVLGPNGSGKTTLLKCIGRLMDYRGEVAFGGESIAGLTRKALARKVGVLFQTSEIYFDYTVAETVMMGRYAHRESAISGDSAADRQSYEQAIETLRLTDFCGRRLSTLSGGELQRVLLARVFAQQPEIILLDEPTNHLDLCYLIEIAGYLKQWITQGKRNVISVIHDLNHALLFYDFALLLNEGRLHAFGEIGSVINNQNLLDVYRIDVKEYMIKAMKSWKTIE